MSQQNTQQSQSAGLPAAATFVIEHAALTHKILRKADAHLSVHGISFSEYFILHELAHAQLGVMRRNELAEALGYTASGITRRLAPMQKIHLIEKEENPRDARVSLVKLSDTGRRIYAETSVTFSHLAEDLAANLSAAQLDKLISLNRQLLA